MHRVHDMPHLRVSLVFRLAVAVLVVGTATRARTAAEDHWVVQVTGGEIRGVNNDGVASFKGVPFAAPPVGDLRWKAPQPVKPWDGVREADKFGPAPMQPGLLAKVQGAEKASEDCLYLNVWTAAKTADERRPVMVWIYGGAFLMGSTSMHMYDGTQFAKKGVVLVSIAYRVGPFGFLAHPELSAESGHGSGCYGIQDQIAALHWVKENIAHFGGDPSRVTIFGESAGGESVSTLAASPVAKGLFQRAIAESGASMMPIKNSESDPVGCLNPSLAFAEAQGKKFLAELGAKDIQAARALSAEDIQKVRLDPCWPVVDGETIVGDPYELYEHGQFNDTPVLVGTNSDDGGMFAMHSPTPEAFETAVRAAIGAAADPILAAYPHATNAEARRAGRDVVRDSLFAWPSWAWVKLQSEKGHGKAYLYYFDHASEPGGAMHSAEIPYVFGNLGGWFMPHASPENAALSDQMMSYWINFATTGDPNGPGLPQWPAFDDKSMDAMIFEKTAQAGPTPNLNKIEAIDGYFKQLRDQGKN